MGPLTGIKVIEMAGLAPSPYCGMLLSDFGAEVVVVDRLSKGGPEIPNVMPKNPFDRGKRSVRINLKTGQGIQIVRRMIKNFDVLVEPYRPGVMEALGLGPEDALALNEKLVYARLTGWGQKGPFSGMAGHDINYIALSGALSLFRRKGEKPLPPCNLLGDFAGGGMLCAMGILLALIEKNRSGKGQVVDAAMVDGATNLSVLFYGLLANNLMSTNIGTNMLDSGAPYYQTYETADGKFVAAGPLEDKFWMTFAETIGLEPQYRDDKIDAQATIRRVAEIIATREAAHWEPLLREADCCCTIVKSVREALQDEHVRQRGLLDAKLVNGQGQTMPATPVPIVASLRAHAHYAVAAPALGSHNDELLG